MITRPTIRPIRAQEIVDLAEEVAGSSIPIDPGAIVSAQPRLQLAYGHFGDAFDGLLEWRDEEFWMYCNLARVGMPDNPRARFTLGHELGHYFIDEHRNALTSGRTEPHPSFSEYQSDELSELEADLFASHLLMPTREFELSMRKVQRGIAGMLKLKEQFNTSLTSTAIRYVKSARFFCAVIKWNPDGYGWKWVSSEAFQGRYIRTVRRHEDLPRDSATRTVMGQQHHLGFEERGTVASTWFDFVRTGGHRDSILVEQAISLGPYGFLTVLTSTSE